MDNESNVKMVEIPILRYLFRKPRFPVIVCIEDRLICGKSANTLSQRILKTEFVNNKTYDVIDSTGEGWSFYPEHWVITPLTLKKKWTKLEIIRRYNGRKNRNIEDPLYSEKSLSTKRLNKIIKEIIELLNKTEQGS